MDTRKTRENNYSATKKALKIGKKRRKLPKTIDN
jgi:hypothetical protein